MASNTGATVLLALLWALALALGLVNCLLTHHTATHTHFHESLMPKGWGDVERLKVVSSPASTLSTRNNDPVVAPVVNAAAVDSGATDTGHSSIPTPVTNSPLSDIVVDSFSEQDGSISPIVSTDEQQQQRPQHQQSQPNHAGSPKLRQFVWRVYNVSEILSSGQELLFSPRFYLNAQDQNSTGYRLQLMLVTNTTYLDNVSYLGVFFRIVAGDNDAQLEWPFKYRTVLSVLDHDRMSNLTLSHKISSPDNISETLIDHEIGYAEWNHTVVPNIDECRLRSAFLRPNSDSDTGANTDGCGNRRHIPLNAVRTDRYSRGDTLLVLVTVHFRENDTSSTADFNQFRRATMSMKYNELVSNYVWAVEQFSERERESTGTGRISILTSNPFYTHPNGYLIQLFLTILPKRNAFAVSIAFVQGDHDRYLQWPFPYSFEMAIVDQSPDYWKRDLTVKVKPSRSDCGTESFSQPGQQPEFCFLTIQSLQVLSLTHYNFLINNTLKIRFTTRFERYSARQQASILLHKGRLVSEFNWLIPGLVARFERYIQESANGPSGASSPTSSASSATRKSHKFVSDEFYTNGQGYLCQLVLTVTVRNVPIENNSGNSGDSGSSSPSPIPQPPEEAVASPQNSSDPTSNLLRMYQPQPQSGQPLSQDVLVFGLELVIIEGEFDRFLEWPFSSAYELSIVGYKNLGQSTNDNAASSSGSDQQPAGGQLYSVVSQPKPEAGSSESAKKTSSSIVIPAQQISKGQCVKEAFQKPIERNPPCGIREFVQLVSSDGSSSGTRRQRNAKSETQKQRYKMGRNDQSLFNDGHSHYELGTLTGKTDEDLHLRVRIYL